MLHILMIREAKYITIKEAAEILTVSKDTLRRWEKAGKLKTKRHPMNNYRLYALSEIEKLRITIMGG